MPKMPTVGVFDSGIGGLNLLLACQRRLPHVNFIYFADNYAVPYGNRGREDILNRVVSVFDEMEGMGVDAAVVACNTVTALCVDFLRKKYAFPIVGIQPAIKEAIKIEGKCLVLATPNTAKSLALNELVTKYGDGRTEIIACPNLAEIIEASAPNFDFGQNFPLPNVSASSVVLGCTHYSYIKNNIRKRYGCPIFDGMVGTADHLATILGKTDHPTQNKGKISFLRGDFCKNMKIYEYLLKNMFE